MTNDNGVTSSDTPPASMAGQAPSDASPMAGQAPSGNKDSSAPTLAQLEAQLADMRKENATNRARLKAFEDAQAAADAAKLSDIEKATKAREAAEASAAAYHVRLASLLVEREAAKLGIIDPELAALAIQGKLTIDKDGNPENAAELLQALVKEKPYLVGSSQPQRVTSGGATNPGKSATTPSDTLSIEKIAAMSRDEYLARRVEINAWQNDPKNLRR